MQLLGKKKRLPRKKPEKEGKNAAIGIQNQHFYAIKTPLKQRKSENALHFRFAGKASKSVDGKIHAAIGI